MQPYLTIIDTKLENRGSKPRNIEVTKIKTVPIKMPMTKEVSTKQ
jgi:hypothetical protein